MVKATSVEKTLISDHNIVKTLLDIGKQSFDASQPVKYPSGFSMYNFQNADFDKINRHLSCLNWTSLHSDHSIESFPGVFTANILKACEEFVPKKRKRKVRKPSRLKALQRKRYRLVRRMEEANRRGKNIDVANFKSKIDSVHEQVKEVHMLNRDLEETRAIEKIKSDPK